MTILLVDDEMIAVNALIRRVKWKKYGCSEVLTANSMKQAMKIFEKQDIDLMLCDIEMPDASGLDLFEWVRTYFPYVECVFITCHPEFEYIQKALRLGSFDYVLKPIDYDELDNILKRILKRLGNNRIPREHTHRQGREKLTKQELFVKSQGDVIRKLKHYIECNLEEILSMEELAAVVHLNSQYMVRLFKKEEGISILEYITNERIKMAKQLLINTDYTIYQVADAVGYSNYSYFSRIFKKQEELSPQEYRNIYKE